ncbi:MAG: hypothetical protein QXN68_05045 [Thermoplasmata archaeon]
MEIIDVLNNNDELREKAIESLFEDKHLFKNSRIKNSDIMKIARLKLYGDFYNLTLIDKLIKYVLQLRISVNGLGRKEVVELVKTDVFTSNLTEPKNGSRGVFR